MANANDNETGDRPVEYLVSSTSADASSAAESLGEFATIAAAAPDIDVLKTIGSDAGLKVVVVSATETVLSQAVRAIPDLRIEKNQPLELFGPEN